MKKELISTDKLLEIIAKQVQENSSQKEEIKLLQEKIDDLLRQKFSSQSEKFNSTSPVSLRSMKKRLK